MTQIEPSVPSRQRPDRPLPDAAALAREVAVRKRARNPDPWPVNWRSPEAGIKPKRLYPSIRLGRNPRRSNASVSTWWVCGKKS